jgi:hypothetical protein
MSPVVFAERRRIVFEHADQAAGRPKRHQHKPKEGGFAGSGRSGQELKGVVLDTEIEIAEHLPAETIAQADILELNHAVLRSGQQG